MTICPNRDQYVAVSRRMSPVTQEALVVVNNASVKDAPSPDAVEIGSMSKSVPKAIISKYPMEMI